MKKVARTFVASALVLGTVVGIVTGSVPAKAASFLFSAPGIPTNLAANGSSCGATTPHSPQLAWVAPAGGAVGYHIVAESGGTSAIDFHTADLYYNSNLAAGYAYTWRVRAFNGSLSSPEYGAFAEWCALTTVPE